MSPGREWQDAIRAVAVKLGKALHYLHSGVILPIEGTVSVRFFSNAQVLAGQFDPDSFPLPSMYRARRGNRDLGEQFSYVFGVTNDMRHSIFVCSFNQSMLVAIQPSCRPLDLDDGLAIGVGDNG